MEPRLNILVAYPYATPQVLDALKTVGPNLRFLLDSGAFTAWKAGKPIELDDYCRFLEGLPVKPWRYFLLDVIGDPQGTLRNYKTMLKRGFTPVPIFTRGEDPSVLNDYYKTSDVVGIGGLVGTPGNRGFVRGIMRHVGDRKVHWLGFTNLEFVKVYKPYMCDSSGWDQSRYGMIRFYLGKGRFCYVKRQNLRSIGPKIRDVITSYGFSVEALASASSWRGAGSPSEQINCASMVRACLDIEKNLGTKQFMAEVGAPKIQSLHHHFRRLTKPQP
ncbi:MULTISPECIES: hypothetical protein [unclassified Vulcanococcus]|jgi:hypothetical protein|uniref:hypothetical protein n=1 Tax=unclassified Vulcanococcus TaxID=2766969 RepID=UPI0025E0E955|nr:MULTISPECIES: hypothetical protein [unclassified Vulcanococcus]